MAAKEATDQATGKLSSGLEFALREPTAKDLAKAQGYADRNEMGETGALIYLVYTCATKWGTRTSPTLTEIEELPAKDISALNSAFAFFRN